MSWIKKTRTIKYFDCNQSVVVIFLYCSHISLFYGRRGSAVADRTRGNKVSFVQWKPIKSVLYCLKEVPFKSRFSEIN